MNNTMLDNINSIVQPDDVLWNLGDVSYGKDATEDSVFTWLNQIKCKNLMLVEGNHDKLVMKSDAIRAKFSMIVPIFIGYICGEPIILTHRPPNDEQDSLISSACQLWAYRHPNVRIFYGHTHNNHSVTPYNLSVENHGYAPVSWEYIMGTKPNIEMFYKRI